MIAWSCHTGSSLSAFDYRIKGIPEQYRFFEKILKKKETAVYKKEKRGYNDNSQKIRKYLSSPKEAFRTAEAAVLGASAMFKASFWGYLECCQVLPSWKPVFIRFSGFFTILHNVCFMVCNTSISGTFYMNLSLSILAKHMFFFQC